MRALLKFFRAEPARPTPAFTREDLQLLADAVNIERARLVRESLDRGGHDVTDAQAARYKDLADKITLQLYHR